MLEFEILIQEWSAHYLDPGSAGRITFQESVLAAQSIIPPWGQAKL